MNNNETISTIIRIHDESGFWQLEYALQSLADQEYKNIQMIVCAQNASKSFTSKIAQHISKIWQEPLAQSTHEDQISIGRHIVCSVSVPNKADGRCLLLKKGIFLASGRYLAFLDYDDVMYPKAYSHLIKQLSTSHTALAAGGCIKAICRIDIGPENKKNIWISSKEAFLENNVQKQQWDLFYGNFLPIHSYLIDLSIVPKQMLKFREDIPLFEDYQMLIHLACQFKFDLGLLGVPICEYRLRLDGSNSVVFGKHDPEKTTKWLEAQSYIEKLKEELTVTLSAKELSDLIQERELLKSQLNMFKRVAHIVMRKVKTFFNSHKTAN